MKSFSPFYSKYDTVGFMKNDDVKSKIAYDTADVIYIRDNTALIPKSIPFHLFRQHYIDFLDQLTPISSINSEVEQFYQENFVGRNVVGVHYRAWGSLEASREDMRRGEKDRVPITEFVNEMQRIIKNDSSVYFYLATDRYEFQQYFQSIFQDSLFHFPFHKLNLRQSVHDHQEALIDWFLLKKTQYLLGTFGSTFSDEAAVLTRQRKKISIGPSVCSQCSDRFIELEMKFDHFT
jgi:hypothetical protein